MTHDCSLAHARQLDQSDPLATFRDRFLIDDPHPIYLDGNSLGRLPKRTVVAAHNSVAHQWGGRLIRAWNEHWIDLPRRLGKKISLLLGASEDEVILADSTSVNLFKLALAALQSPQVPGRSKIVTDDLNFPTDLYVLRSAARLAGSEYRVQITASSDGVTGPADALARELDANTALLTLSHTAFKSGYVYNMDELTARAHAAGALVLWDLSHSVGAVPLSLTQSQVDLAVGCTYKYLCGGPGAPAFLYVRRDLQDALDNPIAGWFGHADQFAFAPDYRPADGIHRFLTGTPPILSLAMIEPGVDLVVEAGVARLREKSVRQTEYLIALSDALLGPEGFTLGSPRRAARRGSHVALRHPDAWAISRALIHDLHVIPDFRAPDTLRLGVCPLYTTYRDLHTAVRALRQVATEGLYKRYSAPRNGVT